MMLFERLVHINREYIRYLQAHLLVPPLEFQILQHPYSQVQPHIHQIQ